MYLFNPIISYFHGNFKNFFELFYILFFNAPVKIIFSEVESKIRWRLFIDSTKKSIDFLLVFRRHILRRVIKTEILYNPLIIISKRKVISSPSTLYF